MKRKIVLIVAICVFLFSAYQLFNIYREYNKGTKEYEEIQESILTEIDTSEQLEDEAGEVDRPTADRFQVDFKKLLELNSDSVAWIRFDEPKQISYPVVHTDDNSTYLTKTLAGQTNSSGTLFVDMVNAGDFSDRNTFIYGHNMKNGSMFGKLREYKSSKYCKRHPYFYIYTPDGKVRTYQVFATAIVESDSDSYRIHFENEEDFGRYIQMVRAGALYETEVEVKETDSIVSLSTCTNVTETQRMIVHGVLISIEDAE